MVKNLFIVICGLILFTGCAARYGKGNLLAGGYSDERISSNEFIISYNTGLLCNKEENPSRKDKFLMCRAAEITLNHGYSHFTVRTVYNSLQIHCYHSYEAPSMAYEAYKILQFQAGM